MRNRDINKKHLLIAIIIGIMAVFSLALIFDNVFDGIFFTWFSNMFISDIYPMGIDTNRLKYLVIATITVLVIIAILVAYAVEKRLALKNKKELAEAISKYMNSDSEEALELPESYGRLADDMTALKNEMQRKEWLIMQETVRKNDLITYLAHDLKTPITSIIGYLSILSEADDMPEIQRKKYIDIVLNKSYRLDELINEFFDITRYNLSSISLEKKDTDISYMLVQIADEFYPMLKEGQEIKLNGEENIRAFIDPDKMARVLNNVIKNAILYGYDNSNINIDAKKDETTVTVKISNNGDTISKEKLSRLFEKFYRGDESRSSAGGAGLGLAIAKEIVKLHEGNIKVESEDNITTFTIEFPIKA